jgi:5-methylcytosine-specific restriction protein A
MVFDSLYQEPPLPVAVLNVPPLDEFRWGIQMSGVTIPDPIAEMLEAAWASATGNAGVGFPDESASANAFPEGAATKVYANRYERNPAARARCLAHYGLRCCVCGMSFAEAYGDLAASYIQVHHLKPLGDIRAEYALDPIQDLRPVCPNCHAVIHLMKPPMSVDEIRQLVESRRGI